MKKKGYQNSDEDYISYIPFNTHRQIYTNFHEGFKTNLNIIKPDVNSYLTKPIFNDNLSKYIAADINHSINSNTFVITNSIPYVNFSKDKEYIHLSDLLSYQLFSETKFLNEEDNWDKKIINDGMFLVNKSDKSKIEYEEVLKGFTLKNKQYTSNIEYNGKIIAKNYNSVIDQTIINDARYLIIPLGRRVDYQSRRIDTFTIIPEKTIKLLNRTLTLVGICCFDGEENDGHYTAYYVCNKKWYRYNDISKKLIIKVADNFDSLISLEKEGNHIKNYALVYFYC
jgi:hypothetical protein